MLLKTTAGKTQDSINMHYRQHLESNSSLVKNIEYPQKQPLQLINHRKV